MVAKMSLPANSLLISAIIFAISQLLNLATVQAIFGANDKESSDGNQSHLTRKSIVFDLKTPKVFYCPQEKQSTNSDKMIVKARPLDRLCEFQGQPKPKNTPSDCYNDVDETDFACDEKKRFMIRLDLASEIGDSASGDYGVDSDLDYILSKSPSGGVSGNKKKVTPNGKKY